MTKTLSQPALLMTESKEDYEALQASLEREIMSRSFVESMYVADIVVLTWEILLDSSVTDSKRAVSMPVARRSRHRTLANRSNSSRSTADSAS